MSDFLPDGWKVEKLDKISSVVDSAHQTPIFSNYGYPMIRVGDIKGGKITLEDTKYVSLEVFKVFTKNYQPTYDDLLMTRVGSYGRCSIVKSNTEFCLGQNTVVIHPKYVDSDYLYYFLQSENIINQIEDTVGGSSQKSLSLAAIKSLKVYTSEYLEQQKIAAILTSVDEVIEKTQAQCDKLKDLKTAMMQTLLTQGVGIDGKPHTEFKDSPVGRIPKEWDCVPLESLLQSTKNSMRSGPFGSTLLKHELVPSGHPYLGIDNVHVEFFGNKFKRFVTDEKFEQLKRYAVKEDDVMITIMGTVGRSCVVPKGINKALSSKHVWTMTFDQTIYIPALICWQLNYSDWVKLQFKFESQGGVMESISSKTLKELWLPLPPIGEQNKIAKTHKALSEVIHKKQLLIKKYKSTKKALMQDLLTGKVRVTVPTPSSAKAS